MRRRLPSLSAVRSFEAAARRLSFLRAAEELAVTPGAVSRQVKALEAELGIALFRRGYRQVTLTPEGEAFFAETREALDRIAAAADRLRGGRRGALAICAHPTFAIRWFIPRWGRFYDRHPEIDVQLTTSLAPVDFTRDGFDAAVRVGTGRWPDCAALKLAEVDLFPVCSPALARAADLRAPADLGRVTLLHSAPRPDDWRRWLKAAGETGVDPDQGLRFDTLNLAFQAAIEGLGVAIGIEALVADDLAQGRLVRPFGPVRRSGHPFWLVWPERAGADPRLARFREWLAEEAGA